MAEEFSIVIPVYNRDGLIERCLESVKNQTYRPLHLVVVDNNSTDHTFQIAAAWCRENVSDTLRITLLHEPLPGACNARNRGLQAVTGRFLMFFDSDDVMHPELASRAMATFRAWPDTDLVCWKSRDHRHDGSVRTIKWARSNFMVRHLIHAVMYTDAYAVRRSFFGDSGNWDAALDVWNDWELGIRLLLREPRIRVVPEILVEKYEQRVSITGENFHSKSGKWEEALDRARASLMASDHPERDRLVRLADYRRVILAATYAREGHPDLARPLLRKALREFQGSAWQRRVLRACYRYTSLGLRGAAIWALPFL